MRHLLIASLLLIVSLARGPAVADDRPNILFIYTDDHSHRSIGCYPESYDWVRTPNIDALADAGVRFHSAYIGTWCMPSRATMLTGHLPFGVQSMRMVGEYPGSEYDAAQCPFWPSVFRQQGYVTAQIGKWHTGTDTGFGRDWDYQKVWNRPRFPENAGHYFYDQLIETNGGEAEMTGGYTTDNYTEWAEEFIRKRASIPDAQSIRDASARKPWYLWLCYGAVHGPFTPADRHLEEYADFELPVPADIYPPRPGKPTYSRDMQSWVPDPETGEPVFSGGKLTMATVEGIAGIHGNRLRDWVRQYHQGVLAIDEGVGRLIQTLKATGQYGNTLIVFTSDQGFAWGQHGFQHKLAPYDATIRSPLIIVPPSTPAALSSRSASERRDASWARGKVCPHPVGGPDLIPTFFAFAGLDLPWEMHGHDLSPLLANPASDWSHPVLTTLTGRQYGSDTNKVPATFQEQAIGGVPWWVSLRQGQYKYIRTLLEGEPEELYDLDADPAELTNLAINPAYRQTLAKFRAETIVELRRTGAAMADHLPPVKQSGTAR